MRLPTLGTLCAILGLAAAAGCATVNPAEPDPLAPWPSFNGGGSKGVATGRHGWGLQVPNIEDDDTSGEEFHARVLADLPAAIALARTVLQQDPEDTRLAKLLWTLVDRKEAEVILLAWDVLERQSWKEDKNSSGAFASLILQLRISPFVSDDERRRVLALLVPLASTPRQQANVATIALRQWCLGSLPPEFTVALAQLLLVEPEFFNIGRELGVNEFPNEFPSGNLRPWRLFMLAGRASVPQLVEDLFHESREIRVGAQWCLERILVTRLKDRNYSVDSPLDELRRLRDKGLVHELKALAR